MPSDKVLVRWYLKRTDLANNVDKHYFLAVRRLCWDPDSNKRLKQPVYVVDTAWGRVGQPPRSSQKHVGDHEPDADRCARVILVNKLSKGYEERPIGNDLAADAALFKAARAPDWFTDALDLNEGLKAKKTRKKKKQAEFKRPDAEWNF